MKKNICLLGALLLCSNALFAEFTLGVRGGYTTSISMGHFKQDINEYSWRDAQNEMSSGYHLGIFMRMGQRFYFQPELLYNHNSSTHTVSLAESGASTAEAERSLKLNTIDMPLLIGFKLVDKNMFNLRVGVGPKAQFNLHSKSSYETASDIDFKDTFRRTVWGAEAGIGFDLLRFIAIDVRYNLMANMAKETTWKDNIKSSYRNPLNTFQVSVGLNLFSLQK